MEECGSDQDQVNFDPSGISWFEEEDPVEVVGRRESNRQAYSWDGSE